METDRLILRNWEEKDIDDLIEGLNNFNISKWLAVVPFPYLRKDAEQWIHYCINTEANKTGYEFCIELKSNQKVIGGISISRINKLNGTAGGGIWLNENFHGMGLGKEAFAEKIRFSFDELGLRKLENGFFDGNESSKSLQERFGYKIEGKRRKKYFCLADGELKDEIITGLLKEEWIKL
ncbi:GNAT family N-acetyltransferase [Leptospira sarikeiensis]|uniref:N-acetyltransferase n=1 Tax=Leptospira sarikeiensis TaxID=2484943 RepID=A0A4R9KCW6_9LEPT|nr:GNAT family protein [Leptospira sarikeiensis]TGL62983.1 N-acetyltransferase [Leptospira sarikeiensis]